MTYEELLNILTPAQLSLTVEVRYPACRVHDGEPIVSSIVDVVPTGEGLLLVVDGDGNG